MKTALIAASLASLILFSCGQPGDEADAATTAAALSGNDAETIESFKALVLQQARTIEELKANNATLSSDVFYMKSEIRGLKDKLEQLRQTQQQIGMSLSGGHP